MASFGAPTSLRESFHLETKYIVLSYLGLDPPSMPGGACASELPAEARSVPEDREGERCRITEEVREELQRMKGTVSTWFSSTDPQCSVEKSLASLGQHVAHELQEQLGRALQTLLSAPLDYELYKAAIQDVSTHAQGGWTKVLVPLVLLHALHEENRPLETLIPLGVRYLEEAEADYIIRQGGWGSVIKLNEGDPCDAIAEDCDDICILSMEQQADRPSPPVSLSGTERGESCSWQTGVPPVSLIVTESWSQVDVMDPEDVKSLDGSEGAVMAEEHSENNSSNSDIVHVEREEAELLESGAEGEVEEAEEEEKEEGAGAETVLPELEESLLSVLGSESELVELKVELSSPTPWVGHSPSADPAPSVGHTPTVNPPPLPLEAIGTREPLASEQTDPIPAAAIHVSHMEAPVTEVSLPPTGVADEPPPPAQDLPHLLMEAELVPEAESDLPVESLQPPLLSAEVQLQPAATIPPKASVQESWKAPPGKAPLQPQPAATTPSKASAQEACKAPPGEAPLKPLPAAATPPKASVQEACKAPPGEAPLQPMPAATTPPKASAQEACKAPPGEAPLQPMPAATTPPKASAQAAHESCRAPPGKAPIKPMPVAATPPKASVQGSSKAPPGEAPLQPQPAATTPPKASVQESYKAPPGETPLQPQPAATTPPKASVQESYKAPPGEAPLQPQPAATTPHKGSAQESCKAPPGEAPLKPEPQPPESSSLSELSALLYGGAALVAIAAALAYGAFLYRRK
ncbi:bcl-2-like protein 13 isoform X2 [Brienomyrus brachyistius]|uniref:bcl-2-like protein 13 isoform X2 n=1 Tax=Brienomyrus brachyistius TaxID=42636 RepID=UPI0020B3D9CC|nr:bcl-2-like protein 13 isoform X2 [Brienomyrus brachyistius]